VLEHVGGQHDVEGVLAERPQARGRVEHDRAHALGRVLGEPGPHVHGDPLGGFDRVDPVTVARAYLEYARRRGHPWREVPRDHAPHAGARRVFRQVHRVVGAAHGGGIVP